MIVLHYIPSIDETSGGLGAYMQLLTKGLGKLCELHVITHHSSRERTLEKCEIHYINNKWLPWNRTKKEFSKLLVDINPDIVHINGCWTPLCSMIAIWAKKTGFKIVYSPHGMLEPWILHRHYWTRKLPAILLYQKKAIGLSDTLHATAESEKSNLLAMKWNDRVQVIGNCIDVDSIFIKSSWKRQKVILFLSRVHVKKGINYLIEAVASLKDDMKDYIVKIAGAGSKKYISELKNMAEHLGVGRMVEFTGAVYGDAKFDLYREADVFVLPTHSENFGIVVAEALACGTPVITTKGAPWAELETKHCGWWTDLGSAPIKNALRLFLSTEEKELKLKGQNGRKLVEEKYSCNKIAQEFIEMYKKVI